MKYVVGVCYIRRLCYGQKYTSWNWRHQSTGACIERRKWDLKRGQKKRTGSSIYKKKSFAMRQTESLHILHTLPFFLVVLKLQNVRVQKHIHMAFRFSSALARRAPIRCTLARCTEVPPPPAGRLAECLVLHPKETHVFPHTNSSIVSGGDEFMTQIPF